MSRLNIPNISRYRKNVGAFGAADVKHDESVLAFNTAAECYNYDFSSGALREGYGVEAHDCVPSTVMRYFVYRYYSDKAARYVDQYVYQQKNGLLMYFDEYAQKKVYISGRAYPPITAINYRLNSRDVLLISCEGHGLITWDGNVLTEYGSPNISSMALHYERLFVTSSDEPTKVFFSDDLDPTNFYISSDEGGFIELLDERGELNKVVSFGNYLYIFRDHGISRVTAYGDQKEFSVANLFVTAGRIYPSSIATCGSCIIFLASDGLYMFDGYECTRVLTNLDGLIEPNDDCACAYFNGRYYLACRMNFRDGKQVGCETDDYAVNGLLVFDNSTGEYSISRGMNIRFMSSCTFADEDFLMCCDAALRGGVITKCGGMFDEALPKHWQSPETEFSAPDLVKSVREVYVKCSDDCSVTLGSDKKKKTVKVKSGDRRLRVNFNAKRLSLAVDTDAMRCDIKPPTLVYSSHR